MRSLFACAVVLCACVPAARADVMIGAFVPDDGFNRNEISALNSVLPKQLAHVQLFTTFSHSLSALQLQTSNIVLEGAMPLITWMPVDLKRPDDNLLPEIASGEWDTYIDSWVAAMHEWVMGYQKFERPRVAIRFAHEFNGNWYPYSNDPMNYISAWQYIHNKVSASGLGDYVDWVWSLSRTNVDSYDDFTLYYPGDEFVDWTSIDGYNWGSNYHFSKWSSFREVFATTYIALLENYPHKPIWISEMGCAEPSDEPNRHYGMQGDNADSNESKSVWIADMLSDLETHFPAVRALTLFNVNKELRWSLTEKGNTGLEAFVEGIASDHFTSDYLTVKTTGLGLGYSTNRFKKDLLASTQRLKDSLYHTVESLTNDFWASPTTDEELSDDTLAAFIETNPSSDDSQTDTWFQAPIFTQIAESSEQDLSAVDRLGEFELLGQNEPPVVSAELSITDELARDEPINLDNEEIEYGSTDNSTGWLAEFFGLETDEAAQENISDTDAFAGEYELTTDEETNLTFTRPDWIAPLASNINNLEQIESPKISVLGSLKNKVGARVGGFLGRFTNGEDPVEDAQGPESIDTEPASDEAVELVRLRALTGVEQFELGTLEQPDLIIEEESVIMTEGLKQLYGRNQTIPVRNMNIIRDPEENLVGSGDQFDQ